ncbi:MAG: hypothetical protein ACTSRL_14775, partial [Candidatus Helarchaeota archaeon]
FLNLQDLKARAKNVLYIDMTNHITATALSGVAPKTDREAYEEVLQQNFSIKPEDLNAYVALLENIVKITNDRDFTELTEKILEEFVSKNFDAIKPLKPLEQQEASISKKAKKALKKPKKAPKKRKKPRPVKKLSSYK